MRRKRLIRPPMPGCSLELMSDNSHCEVQVRVQDDLGGLLIASDDALGSPILASQACFNCAGDDGAAESHIPDPSQSQAAKSSVAPSSTSSSYHTKACEGSTRMDVTDTHAVSGHNNNNKVHGGNKDGLRSGPVSTHCSNTTRKGGLALGCDAVGEAASSLSSSSYAPNKATMGTRHHGNSLTISTSVAHHTTPCAKDFDRGGLVGGPPRGDGVTRSTGTSSTLSSRGMMPQRGSAGGAERGNATSSTATVRSPSTAAKFIHVNNTNLFVLIDGVSMFVEGTGACHGETDALLAQLSQKRRHKASAGTRVGGGVPASAASSSHTQLGHVREKNVSGGERDWSRTLRADGGASILCGAGDADHADSVDDAIRDIELTDGVALPSRASPCVGGGTEADSLAMAASVSEVDREEAEVSTSQTGSATTHETSVSCATAAHTAATTCTSAPTSTSTSTTMTTTVSVEQPRNTSILPRSFVGLFANAQRPATAHQFGRHHGTSRCGAAAQGSSSPAASVTQTAASARNRSAERVSLGQMGGTGAHHVGRVDEPSSEMGHDVVSASATAQDRFSSLPCRSNSSNNNSNIHSNTHNNSSKSECRRSNVSLLHSGSSKLCQDGSKSSDHAGAGAAGMRGVNRLGHDSRGALVKGDVETNRTNHRHTDVEQATQAHGGENDGHGRNRDADKTGLMCVGSNSGGSRSRSVKANCTTAAVKEPQTSSLPCTTSASPVHRSFDTDDVEILDYIGGGTQGKVYRVRVDGTHYALKCIDIMDTLHSTSVVERQGRKRGLAKELNMIRLQRQRPPCTHLMKMYNAAVSEVAQRKKVSLLMELMAFSLEDAQKMVARIPQNELMKISQAAFGDMPTGRAERDEDRRLKHELGSCMHILGRRSYDAPEDWEKKMDRQTGLPEVVLSMIAADVLRGLRELHEDYRIVHCDLKPDNVLLNYDKQTFKLADFGCGCAMDDGEGGTVRLTGIDLGSKLYKAPERLSNAPLSWDAPSSSSSAARATGAGVRDTERKGGGRSGWAMEASTAEEAAGAGESKDEITFTAKADVWSLGIMLLELSCGVHPCSPFKSDFWNYTSLLKLTKMVKPLTWSYAFFDFVTRCVCADVQARWSPDRLLQHPFVRRYEEVRRSKLKRFMERLESESTTFQRKQQLALLERQILLSTANQAKDNDKKKSLQKWQGFTGFLKEAPLLTDTTKFPPLRPCM